MNGSGLQGLGSALIAVSLTAFASIVGVHAAPLSREGGAADTIWITNITVIDPAVSRSPHAANVAIRGHTIRAVLPIESVPDQGAERIDGTGKFLIPGLWDMHVHIADAGYLDLFIANGVLGVRDMGGGLEAAGNGCESLRLERLKEFRREVESGLRVGPEMVLSGPAISGTGWPTSLPAGAPAEAVASVNRLSRMGVDFIKVYERIPLDAYLSMAAEARALDIPFAGHVPESVELLRAIREGQRSIEHLRDPILMCFTQDLSELERFFEEDRWTPADRQWGRSAQSACESIFDALRSRRTWVTPTLVVEKAKVAVEDPAFLRDDRRQALPASVRAGLVDHARSKLSQAEHDRRSERLWWRTQQALVGRLGREGVPLLAGTDAACQGGIPGYSLHDELSEMVAAGLSPQQALHSATSGPADFLGRHDLGGIAAGMRANLLVLGANPLDDIRNTRSIEAVILQGRLLDRMALDEIGGISDGEARN